MGVVQKWRGIVMGVAGYVGTATTSLAALNISSDTTIQKATLTTGPVGAARWAGFTSIASGDTSVVVSNANLDVKSGFPVVVTGISNTASHVDLITSVLSIVDGTSFTIQVQNAVILAFDVAYIITV